MKKQIKYQESVWYDPYITECKTLKEVLEVVGDLIKRFGGDAEVEFDSGYNNISESLLVYKEREETDSEYSYRIKQEQKKVDKERKEYERLKAKFGE